MLLKILVSLLLQMPGPLPYISPAPSAPVPPVTITLIAHVAAAFPGTSVTTSNIDTTGADFCVANLTGFLATGTVSDSFSNTWQALTVRGAAPQQLLYYAANAVTGLNHNFSVTSGQSGTIQVACFSNTGAAPFDVEAGATGSSTSPQAGSVTPSVNGSLKIAALATNNSGGTINSVNSGFIVTDISQPAGANEGGALAYLVDTTAVASDPIWTLSAGLSWAAENAVFKP